MVAQRISPSGPLAGAVPTPPAAQAAGYVLTGQEEFKPLFGAGEFPHIYVAVDGSDSENTGLTIDSPFATIKAALLLALVSSVESTIHLAPGEHSPEGLDDPRLCATRLKIVGDESEVLAADLVSTGYISGTRTFNFAAESWSANEWDGAFLKWKSGASNPPEATRTKTIHTTGASSLTMCRATNALAPGEVWDIVRPAAVLVFSEELRCAIAPSGGITTEIVEDDQTGPNVYRILENVRIKNTAGGNRPGVNFSGTWLHFGVLAECDSSAGLELFFSGEFFAGALTLDTPYLAERIGWGISGRTSVVGPIPSLTFNACNASFFCSTGRVISQEGSDVIWAGGSIRDSRIDFPHGAIASLSGSHFRTYANSSVGRLIVNAGTQASFVAESNSMISIAAPVTHEGSGQFIRCRYASSWVISQNPIITGTNTGCLAEYGGIGRIAVVDGSTLGPCIAGGSIPLGQVTRPAGAFLPGDAVCVAATLPKDLANIFRSN